MSDVCSESTSHVADNLALMRSRMREAAQAAGRNPRTVRLVAVSKTKPAESVVAAYAAGQRLFGENRVQELAGKAPSLPEDCEWHLIGPLQKNKVRPAVKAASWIHTLDSVQLVERVDRIAGEEGRRIAALVQVNVSGEESKHGCSPADAIQVVQAVIRSTNLDCEGLMTIAPYGVPEEELRSVFRGLRVLRDKLEDQTSHPLPDLSMGMSGDFGIAIAEGATLVRIGTAIFGARMR